MPIRFDKSKLVKNLASGDIIVPFLEREFNTFDEPWTFDYATKEHDDAWHPSGDCTPSATDLYNKALSTEHEVISSSLRKSFMVGHFWHQFIQYIVLHKLEFCSPDAIECRGIKHWGEHDTVKGKIVPRSYHWVTGLGDIAPLETGKWRGVVDIKTMSSSQFKQGSLPAWAASKYLCQLNMYMDLFDEEQGMILAVNKDAPHDFKEFRFTRDQPLVDAIYTKWKFVSECLDNETPPTEEDNERLALPIRE